MKRRAVPVAVLSLVLGLSSLGFAQNNAPAPRHDQGERVFKALDPDNTGRITREAFMEAAQKRAMIAWEQIDPNGKGYVTKEDFLARTAAAHAHRAHRHGKPAPAQQQ